MTNEISMVMGKGKRKQSTTQNEKENKQFRGNE